MGEPNTPTIDELLAEWEDVWLESLKYQVYELHHRREIHDEFMDLLEASGHPDTEIFRDAYHGMYIEAQVMAIRRQADDDPRTLSLRRLIGQIEPHRRKFTRSWYVSRWMDGVAPESDEERERLEAQLHLRMANDAFDQFSDAVGDEVLSGRRLQEDRAQLVATTDQVVRYANATVAHAERTPGDVKVTYGDFHRALDHLGQMLRRYYLLINQEGSRLRPQRSRATGRARFVNHCCRRRVSLSVAPCSSGTS